MKENRPFYNNKKKNTNKTKKINKEESSYYLKNLAKIIFISKPETETSWY